MTHRIRRRLLTSALCAAFVASGAIPGAMAAGLTKLTVSYSQKTFDFAPLWIASDAGYFKKHGLDVTVRYLPAQEGIPALLDNQVQTAGTGGSDAASAEAQGAKLKLVAVLTPVYPFQFWARPQYASAKALKGQRVGITSTTGSLYSGTLLALKQLGLTTSDVVITPLGPVTNVNASLLAGSIVAAASHPPATYKFKRAGLKDVVDLAKKKIPSVSAGVWVTQSFLQGHRAVVQDLVDAILEGIHREKTDRAFAEQEMTKHLGIKNKGELDFTYNYYINELLVPGPMPQVAQLQSNITALSASNAKVKTIDAASMVDQSFVKNAENQHSAAATGKAKNSATASNK